MFVIYDKGTKVPIKIWLPDGELPEDNCMEQAYNLANLPFLHKWVALMPDTHAGVGMPIGGVIATEDIVIPNAVGKDIGCGMAFAETNIKVEDIKEISTPNGTLIRTIVSNIMRNIPLGFKHHTEVKRSETIDRALGEEFSLYEKNDELIPQIERGYYQIGTLGGGNHFIELQEDEEGHLCVMLHSGSRHLGNVICSYFDDKAKKLNERWGLKADNMLAFFPLDTDGGKQYMNWMKLASDFAYENRAMMMIEIKNILNKCIAKYIDTDVSYQSEINCHHNYATMEEHYKRTVLVHRKGATRANEGELTIIPGAMGSYSYIARGKGNALSFCSSSHGAGRRYSRKAAVESFSVEEVMVDLKNQGVVLGKQSKKDVAEESRFAYKDINEVMKNQEDLVTPVKKLKTLGVVKG